MHDFILTQGGDQFESFIHHIKKYMDSRQKPVFTIKNKKDQSFDPFGINAAIKNHHNTSTESEQKQYEKDNNRQGSRGGGGSRGGDERKGQHSFAN